jgi:hypothetical protein
VVRPPMQTRGRGEEGGAWVRWSGVTTCKGKGKGAWQHSIKGAASGERKEGEARRWGHRVEEGQGA